jgi:FkbM family methyltransferase
MVNDPTVNGEYLLLGAWAQARAARARASKTQVTGEAAGEALEIVDVGANVGAWSAHLIGDLARAGVETYRIRAVEPAPAQRAALAALCRTTIDAGRLTVDPRGLAATPGKASFNVMSDTSGANALVSPVGEAAGDQSVEIDVTTLDAMCAEAGVARLHLVKVDTEGNDFNVILGAQGLFDREAIDILQFEYNWRWVAFGRLLNDVFAFLKGRPYRLGRLGPDGVEFYDDWHPELERFIETNYVIAHRDALDGLPHWRAAFDGANTAVRIRDGGAARTP